MGNIDRELKIASRGVYHHPIDGLCEIDKIFKAYNFRVGESIHNDCRPERGSTINPIQTTAGVGVGIVTIRWIQGHVEATAEFRQ